MFEFLIATGLAGVIGLFSVFLVVFLLAKPGKEISFWGIKFHKKDRRRGPFCQKRIPKPLPTEWQIVLRAFVNLDKHHIHEADLYRETKKLESISELKTRDICSTMKQYGLINHVVNYVSLTERALPLLQTIDK